jgi:hypothetical protein
VSELAAIGLNAIAERVYRTLVGEPLIGDDHLAAVTGLTHDQIGEATRELRELGLVSRENRPLPPESSLNTLLAAAEEQLTDNQQALLRVRRQLPDLAASFATAMQRETARLEVEIITDISEARLRNQQLQASARRSIVNFVPALTPVERDPSVIERHRALDKLVPAGIHQRLVEPAEVCDLPAHFAYLQERVASGLEDIRIGTMRAARFIVIDDVAILALHGWSMRDGVLVVHTQPVVRALLDLFELLWANATPIGGNAELVGHGRRRRLLQLLSEGVTDEAGARALGVATRTFRREVAAIAKDVGAKSRFQLGMIIAEAGAFSPTEDLSQASDR